MPRSFIKISDLNRCPPPNCNPCFPPHCPPQQCNPCYPAPNCCPYPCPTPNCCTSCPPTQCNTFYPPHQGNCNNYNNCSSSDSSSDDDSSYSDRHKKHRKKNKCNNGRCLSSDLFSSKDSDKSSHKSSHKSSKDSHKSSHKSSDNSSYKKHKKDKKHKKKCRKCNSSKCKCIKYYNSYETDCGWIGLCISLDTNPNTPNNIIIRNIGTAYITNMSIYTSYNNCIQPINQCLAPCGSISQPLPTPQPAINYSIVVYVQVGKCKYVYSNTLCINVTPLM